MTASPSHYEVLGVSQNASEAEIKSAFREAAKRQHPDQGGNAALFRLVEQAYEVLIDPARRDDYDADLGGGEPTPPRGTPIDEGTSVPRESDFGPRGDKAGEDDSSFSNQRSTPATADFDYERQNRNRRSGTPDWFPDRWVKRALVVVAVATYVAVALLLTGQLVPGVANGSLFEMFLWLALLFFLGSLLLRMSGILLLVGVGLAYAFDAIDGVTATIGAGAAFMLWLAGHWFYTRRHGHWRSFTAYSVMKHLPNRLRPDRGVAGAYR